MKREVEKASNRKWLPQIPFLEILFETTFIAFDYLEAICKSVFFHYDENEFLKD